VGGDILANKKTFLLIHAFDAATEDQKTELNALLETDEPGKVERVLSIFKACGVDEWARQLKEKYITVAFQHLEDIAVISVRKKPLHDLANFLMQRDY
jgi:geranylgeranyl diphosphate synthase type II